ncbi:MAG: [protein-PII] uridylyltransferase [Symploca sp. SIO2G7]|nr:[protein-PII] uridylyltransferase [Symploca sp. SIO2G7]
MTNRLIAPPVSRNCLDLKALAELAKKTDQLSTRLGQASQQAQQKLAEEFTNGAEVSELVQARAWVVEQLVLTAWSALIDEDTALALVAVGGFGRGEMHPYSDVDVLILQADQQRVSVNEKTKQPGLGAIEQFVRVLWDAGLNPGHGVRTVTDCLAEAVKDVTVATNLMEARLIEGSEALFDQMLKATSAQSIWPSDEFFAAKLAEQEKRHDDFEDTVYNLEPNIKSGPGGLRDVQTIAWVAHRHFGTSTLHGLVDHGFLSEREHEQLVNARQHLWAIRWALHQTSGQAEEQLLFEHQRTLARVFGFDQAKSNASVEQFMQRYYRTAMRIERLNEQLLQMFEEELLSAREHLPSAEIDQHFRQYHGYLEVTDDQVFVRHPELLLKVFLVLADHQTIRGVRASTIRLIRDHLYLIDTAFCSQTEHWALFLQLLGKKRRVYSQLERMNRYGVLAALIPGFAEITGRMQFDLFHVYTVDQHILFVIRNLRRFARGNQASDFSRPIKIFQRIQKPETLYLAALFHDIAKGRGGDHSTLGAIEARAWVQRLPLPPGQRELTVWLVENHLVMSMTAQRQDISDPAVVDAFAEKVGSRERLNYLYLLTAADISATRPKLWNSWKDALLWRLFEQTEERLEVGLNHPINTNDRCQQIRDEALSWLIQRDDAAADASRSYPDLWSSLPQSALIRMEPDQLAWSSAQILKHASQSTAPLVAQRRLVNKQITELLIYCDDFDGLFAIASQQLDRMRINVLAARIATTHEGMAWNLFQLQDAQHLPLNASDAARLEQEMMEKLVHRNFEPLVARALPRRVRTFINPSEIRLDNDATGSKTRLEIASTDRPGLLSLIARALFEVDVRLLDARIVTFGQRVDDIFVLESRNGECLSVEQRCKLEQRLRELLDPSSLTSSVHA